MKPTICVDLDGTLIKHNWQGPDYFEPPLEGAKEFLEELRKIANIIIFTCRCNTNLVKESMVFAARRVREFMDKNNLPYDDIWAGKGKPVADLYIDDRGVYMPKNPSKQDFEIVLKAVQNRLKNGP